MKIAVPTSELGGLEAPLNHHFGQTKVFTIVTVGEKEIKDVTLVRNAGPHSCAGVVELLRNTGAEITIVGGIGERPLAIMQHFGMKVYSGATGTVKDVIQAFLKDELQEISDPHC